MGIKKKNVSFDPVGESAAISIHACYAPPRRAEMVPPARRRTRSEIKSAKSVRARRPPLPFAASLFGGEERSRSIVPTSENSADILFCLFRAAAVGLFEHIIPRTVRGKIFAWSNRLVKSCAISQIDY